MIITRLIEEWYHKVAKNSSYSSKCFYVIPVYSVQYRFAA